MLTHGHHEVLRNLQGSLHFARNQRLRLETLGWCVLDFHGNQLSQDELERQKRKSRRVPLWCVTVSIRLRRIWSLMGLVLLTRSYQFSQKCLAWWMRWGWKQLWTRWEAVGAVCASRRASQHWSSLDSWRNSGRFSEVNFQSHFASFQINIAVLLSVNHFNRNATPNSVTHGWLG